MQAQQLWLWPTEKDVKAHAFLQRDSSSTFADNLSLPIHRWFRYSAGFSALWVSEVIRSAEDTSSQRVLDPFVGSGTVLIEAERCGVQAIGLEAHPFVARVARAKLLWRESPKEFREFALDVLSEAQRLGGTTEGYPKLIYKCYPKETLADLDALKRAWQRRADGGAYSELTWLALVAILRATSPVGTAQWQYVLPKKSKAKVLAPFQAFKAQVLTMASDMAARQREEYGPQAQVYPEDARRCSSVPDNWATLVITSPPYANNYDYADATRLEMSFFGEVQSWGDLQRVVRRYLIRSCTQHVAKMIGDTFLILSQPELAPIKAEIWEVCTQLARERRKHGGRKAYHTMIAAYFSDMALVWKALRKKTAPGGKICFVIGDSAPYGVHVPVERWLGELALAAGFKSYRFEKIRDRNVKWKNRKHRVPLHEGRLWVEG